MPRETKEGKAARVKKIIAGLKKTYPDAHCELNYSNPLELLIATILSAQCTDKRVNLVTADLLRKVFAYKVARENAAPTLLVIEEAHSFVSREKGQTMHATLQMLRDVARRGRKR